MVEVRFRLVKRDFVWIGLIVVLACVGFGYAYGGSSPNVMGHSAGEIGTIPWTSISGVPSVIGPTGATGPRGVDGNTGSLSCYYIQAGIYTQGTTSCSAGYLYIGPNSASSHGGFCCKIA